MLLVKLPLVVTTDVGSIEEQYYRVTHFSAVMVAAAGAGMLVLMRMLSGLWQRRKQHNRELGGGARLTLVFSLLGIGLEVLSQRARGILSVLFWRSLTRRRAASPSDRGCGHHLCHRLLVCAVG